MEVTYDERADVLYVKRDDARPTDSRSGADDYVVMNRDAGCVVGLQVLAASEMPLAFWIGHPDRAAIPYDLWLAVSDWINAHA